MLAKGLLYINLILVEFFHIQGVLGLCCFGIGNIVYFQGPPVLITFVPIDTLFLLSKCTFVYYVVKNRNHMHDLIYHFRKQ